MATKQYNIGIIGGGSWATALAKIILSNQETISWFMRSQNRIEDFKNSGHNSYLKNVLFDTEKIHFYTEDSIIDFISNNDIIILCVPSPYVYSYIKDLPNNILTSKIILSAVKGMIPKGNILISEYLNKKKKVDKKNIGIISGPCHAEEVAYNKNSYLTLGCFDLKKAEELSLIFSNTYIKCRASNDVVGIEYASVLKNVYAIAAGICHGLKYGDNFQSVLLSNAIEEMKNFLDKVEPKKERNITESVYLGDLLVTSYSEFSRNRTLGTMIGKGYTLKQANQNMDMIAEGYFGSKCIHNKNKKYKIKMDIAETVYNIVHKEVPADNIIIELIKNFK